ncbi:MAG: hypothetical protein ABIR58_00825 [Gemmatimonadaceae bacterium]
MTVSISPAAEKNRGRKFFPIALAALSALYLLQTATPLRLDSDALRYFRIAMSLADGLPLPSEGFPVGYPAVIATLDVLGLGSSFFIVLANCFFLALSLAAAWYLGSDRPVRDRQWALLLTILAVPVIRSIAMPLPEPAYLAVSLLALASMRAATTGESLTMGESHGRFWYLILAAALCTVALIVRLAGIALLPPLVWSCVLFAHRRIAARRGRRLVIVTAIALIVLALGVFAPMDESGAIVGYLDDAAFKYSAGEFAGNVYGRVIATLRALGELGTNLPLSQFYFLAPYMAWLGAVVAVFLLFGLRNRWRLTPVSVYVATYVAILVAWPHYSTRLWVPVIPLLMLHTVGIARELAAGRRSQWLVRACLAFYALGGIAALAYTSRISLSGDRFATLYGKSGGFATPGYEAENPGYNEDAATIFRRFDARRKH